MTLLAPGFLLFGLLAIPVVLMYVLRLRRPERAVSSTLLWPRLVGDMQANAPWQRLRPSLLLVLQVLGLLALALALAQPAYSRSTVIARDVIVVLDQSYSMQARDVTPSRFGAAQAHARSVARDLAAGNVMSVIGMGSQPHLALAESDDPSTIDRAIARLRPELAPPNVLAALSLAASLGRQGRATQILVLTDHSSGISALPLSVRVPVQIVRFGGSRRDLAIASFTARAGRNTRAVIRLRNYGRQTAASDLKLYGDGTLLDVRPVRVPAGGEDSATWDSLPAGIHRLRAHLGRVDDMPVDKTAWAVLTTAQRRSVLLVTRGNYFLKTALSLDPSVHVTTVAPTEYGRHPFPNVDLTVFDSVLPGRLPTGSTMLIDPPRSAAGIRVGPVTRLREAPIGGVAGAPGRLLRYVDLSDVHVARAHTLGLPSWLRPVAASGDRTVLAVGDRGSSRVAVLSFRLQESDWPLRVSFPIVLRNLVSYLAPSTLVSAGTVSSGQPITLIPPNGTVTMRVVKPDRSVDELLPPFPPFTDTVQPGVYGVRVSPRGSRAEFAVNSFAARHTDASSPRVQNLGESGSSAGHRVSISFELGWAFGVLALALLGAEWWMTFKR